MLYNEEQVPPEGDLNRLSWVDGPQMDSLGAAVVAHRAFRVKTREELARVLEAAGEEKVLVRPAGALTSSKAFVAPPAGFMAEHKKKGVWLVGFDPSGEFGEIHVDFAITTTVVYTILAVVYSLTWFKDPICRRLNAGLLHKVWNSVDRIREILMNRVVLFILSGLGFVLLSITGALGGALAYGPDVDPVVSFLYHLLVN